MPSSTTIPASSTTAAPALVALPRLGRRPCSRQLGHRVALASLGVILLYGVGCLVLVQAPVDQPELPGTLAGFGLAPLIGLLFAYLVTRTALTRRWDSRPYRAGFLCFKTLGCLRALGL